MKNMKIEKEELIRRLEEMKNKNEGVSNLDLNI